MNLFSTFSILLALAVADATCFCPTKIASKQQQPATTQLFQTSEDVAPISPSKTDTLIMPSTYSEMCRQVSSAMRDAFYEQKIKRQIVRVLLPRDASNAQLGVISEGILDVDSQNIILVPTDESWQGGIMQLYRSAAPTCSDVLRLFTRDDSGVPPRIVEDRSVDESGVDGVGLLKAELGDEKANCFVQPSQETIEDYVVPMAKQSGLILLFNPQWRLTDDVFDSASQETGFFGKVATFLGGKGGTLKKLDEMNFESVYNFEGYVCRGYNVRMIKR